VGDCDDGPPGHRSPNVGNSMRLARAPSRKQPRATAFSIHGGTTMRGDEKCSCSCVYLCCKIRGKRGKRSRHGAVC
jgi:hypothetical protein